MKPSTIILILVALAMAGTGAFLFQRYNAANQE